MRGRLAARVLMSAVIGALSLASILSIGVGESEAATSGATGATGSTGTTTTLPCTGPYRGCNYNPAAPVTGSNQTGPNCTVNVNNTFTQFSALCTDLSNSTSTSTQYPYGLNVELTLPDPASSSTQIYLDFYLDDGNGNLYALGGPTSELYWNSNEALQCSANESAQACAAAGSSPVPGYTMTPTASSNCTSETNVGSNPYYLFPPGTGGQGVTCVPTPLNGFNVGHNVTPTGCVTTANTQTAQPYQCDEAIPVELSTTTVTSSQPCTVQNFTGPASPTSPTDAHYSATMSAGSTTLLAVPNTSPNFATLPPSWNTYTGVNGNTRSGFSAPIASDGTSQLEIDMSTATSFGTIELYCQASSGAWSDLGTIASIIASETTANPTSGTDCYSTLSWGWNPGTDVLSGFKALGCVAQSLFVPTSSALTALTNQFGFTSSGGGSGCSATAPTTSSTGSISQWVGAGFTLISTGPGCAFQTMQSDANAGQTSPILDKTDTFTGAGQTFAVGLPQIIAASQSNSDIANITSFVLLLDTGSLDVALFFLLKDLFQWVISKT